MSIVPRLRTPALTGLGGQDCFHSLEQETCGWGMGVDARERGAVAGEEDAESCDVC